MATPRARPAAAAWNASRTRSHPASRPARAGPAPPAPTPALAAAATAWSDRPFGFRLAASIGAAVAVVLFLYLINNWDSINGNEFKVGDCVTVSAGVLNDDMDPADCGSGKPRSASLDDQVYRVEAVIDGKDGRCPGGGFSRITFSNEPEDTTYCLIMTR